MIYLASPYSHEDPAVREKRYHAAMEATARLINNGIHIISPIVHGHAMAEKHNMKGDFQFWNEYCIDMMLMCESILVLKLPGWQNSIGVTAEIKEARKHGIYVMYMDVCESFATT